MESNRNRDQLNLLKEGNGFFLKEQYKLYECTKYNPDKKSFWTSFGWGLFFTFAEVDALRVDKHIIEINGYTY